MSENNKWSVIKVVQEMLSGDEDKSAVNIAKKIDLVLQIDQAFHRPGGASLAVAAAVHGDKRINIDIQVRLVLRMDRSTALQNDFIGKDHIMQHILPKSGGVNQSSHSLSLI